MARTSAGLRLALALAAGATPATIAAQDPAVVAEQGVQENELYTVEELDNLLAPVALYPDPILAQLLVAATYPEQVALAQRYVQTYGAAGVDEQAWDVSVKAIARYEPVLNMLAERPNWATAVGRAYALQPGDVMASVQSLRRMAQAQGNLVTTSQQRVEVEPAAIRIVPAQPQVIYVPVYDPYVVYHRPVNYLHVHTPYWSFGMGYPIGAWLGYDFDWGTRVVYYHGWHGYGRRHTWYHVSRPYISFSGIWVSPRRTVVVINRTIVRRHVRYDGFDRYNYVHRRTHWDRRDLPGRGVYVGRGGKEQMPDRYGIPTRRNDDVYKPGKEDDGVVPRVGRAPAPGTGGPGRGGYPGTPGRGSGGRGDDDRGRGGDDRGRGNDRDDDRGRGGDSDLRNRANDANRVKPLRIGGERRPLYPGSGEDLSPDRIKGGTVARRETGGVGGGARPGAGTGGGDGTWNPRSPDPVRAPRTSADRATPRFEPIERARPVPRGEAGVPRATPRSAPSTRGYEPRSTPSTRGYEPRSTPRASIPRASAPRESAPRASAPRQSAPRASAPRASGSSGGRASAPSSGGGKGSARGGKGGRD